MLILIVVRGPSKGRVLEIKDFGRYVIGRQRQAGQKMVWVPDTKVSRSHAELFYENGRWYIEDLGSTNGTYMNREQILGPTPVEDGDQILLGRSLLVAGTVQVAGEQEAPQIAGSQADELLSVVEAESPSARAGEEAESDDTILPSGNTMIPWADTKPKTETDEKPKAIIEDGDDEEISGAALVAPHQDQDRLTSAADFEDLFDPANADDIIVRESNDDDIEDDEPFDEINELDEEVENAADEAADEEHEVSEEIDEFDEEMENDPEELEPVVNEIEDGDESEETAPPIVDEDDEEETIDELKTDESEEDESDALQATAEVEDKEASTEEVVVADTEEQVETVSETEKPKEEPHQDEMAATDEPAEEEPAEDLIEEPVAEEITEDIVEDVTEDPDDGDEPPHVKLILDQPTEKPTLDDDDLGDFDDLLSDDAAEAAVTAASTATDPLPPVDEAAAEQAIDEPTDDITSLDQAITASVEDQDADWGEVADQADDAQMSEKVEDLEESADDLDMGAAVMATDRTISSIDDEPANDNDDEPADFADEFANAIDEDDSDEEEPAFETDEIEEEQDDQHVTAPLAHGRNDSEDSPSTYVTTDSGRKKRVIIGTATLVLIAGVAYMAVDILTSPNNESNQPIVPAVNPDTDGGTRNNPDQSQLAVNDNSPTESGTTNVTASETERTPVTDSGNNADNDSGFEPIEIPELPEIDPDETDTTPVVETPEVIDPPVTIDPQPDVTEIPDTTVVETPDETDPPVTIDPQPDVTEIPDTTVVETPDETDPPVTIDPQPDVTEIPDTTVVETPDETDPPVTIDPQPDVTEIPDTTVVETPEEVPAPAINSAQTAIAKAGSLVFLIDASGSQIDTLPLLINRLNDSLKMLKDDQQFTVIFFQNNRAIEAPSAGLKPADAEHRRKVGKWMQPGSGQIIAMGSSNPFSALRLAASYEPDRIIIFSDRLTGTRPGQVGEDALFNVLDEVRGENDIAIDTVHFFYKDDKNILKRIADKYEGYYTFIEPPEATEGLAELGILNENDEQKQ